MNPLAIDRRAAAWGGIAVLVALALAILGSSGLRWFDAALAGYLLGTLFAVFAVVYRYVVWARRPPTARLNRLRQRRGRHRPHGGGGGGDRCAVHLPVPRPHGILRDPWQLVVLVGAVILLVAQGLVINRLAGVDFPAGAPRGGTGTP